MEITLNRQEMMLFKQKAEEYRKKTGDNYSSFHMMSILSDKYENSFVDDLNYVLDKKLDERREELANGNK